MVDQPLLTEIQHFLRRIYDFEQGLCSFVDALICRLRRKRHGHHERIGVHMIELPLWFSFAVFKPREDFAHNRIGELFCHGRSI